MRVSGTTTSLIFAKFANPIQTVDRAVVLDLGGKAQ